MANRPGTLCDLKSGKAIGAQPNFADTFNWVVACLKNLKAGRGISLNWPSSDTPEISLDGGDGNGGENGGGITDAVYDVSDSYDSSKGKQVLTVSYTDGRADKNIELSGGENGGGITDAVYDVSDSYDSSKGKQVLTVSYTDGRADKNIELSGGGEVKMTGTDDSYTSGNEFTFASEDDSNVTVNCSGGVIKIGVYYL